MPPFEEIDRPQLAVLWVTTGRHDANGQLLMDDPVEINVDWNWGTRLVPGAGGNLRSVDARVVVDRDIPIGSLMWEGGLEDIPGTSLVPESDLMEVVDSSLIRDIKGAGDGVHGEFGVPQGDDAAGLTEERATCLRLRNW